MFAAKLDISTRSLCQAAFSPLASQQSIYTEQFLNEVRIEYVALDFSVDEHDSTHVKLCWRGVFQDLWICSLQVANAFRGLGIGRKLVMATEQLARCLKAHSIHLFPLQRARAFWLKIGFEPHASMSRVLTKTLPTQDREFMTWTSS